MLEKILHAYDIAAKSSCSHLVVLEDTGTGLYSPGIFTKYISKALREYVEIAHKYGKKILVHSFGLLNNLIENFVKTGIDGITGMTPFPTGNINFLDVRKRIGRDVILTEGIDTTVITGVNKNYLEKEVLNLIRDMKPYGNFILGCGDAMPANTPIENLELAYTLVEKYGNY